MSQIIPKGASVMCDKPLIVTLALRLCRHAAKLVVVAGGLFLLLLLLSPSRAHADSFSRVRYDREHDQLVLTMSYRGTNPNHHFSLKWGPCENPRSDGVYPIVAEVLDDQWQDRAEQVFRKTRSLSLAGLTCRPARLTLRTAPRFYYTLNIPAPPVSAIE